MKLFRSGALVLVIGLALMLVSCDAMFTNVFAGTRTPPTASEIERMSPSEIQDLMDSEYYRQQLIDNASLRDAAVATLEATFGDLASSDPVAFARAQVAATAAADIIIKTTPAAAFVSAAAVGALVDLSSADNTMDQTAAVDIITKMLPLSITNEIGSPVPPADFVEMIAAFESAYAVYMTLAPSIDAGAYSIDASIGADQALPIAVNAAIAVFINAVLPLDEFGQVIANPTPDETVNALWVALAYPQNAASVINFDATTLTTAFEVGGTLDDFFLAAGVNFNMSTGATP